MAQKYGDETATPTGPVIGIDLGTKNCCIGIWDDQSGRVEIIPNSSGKRTTPSIVARVDGEWIVGEVAEQQQSANSENTIYDAKRLIGRQFSEPSVQEDIKDFSFRVEADSEDSPVICFTDGYRCSPEHISAELMRYLKTTAEEFLGTTINDAVVTVPAYFNDGQRQATKDAGKLAGLNVLRLVVEPTAAAVAYGLEKNKDMSSLRRVLVYDLGGGTFDVSLLEIQDGVFEVKATAGDVHLGGEDLDTRVVNWAIAQFAQQTGGSDIRKNSRAVRRLRTAAEQAKCRLSAAPSTTLGVDYLVDGQNLSIPLSRIKFEQLCADLFIKTMEPVNQVLRDQEIATPARDLHDVVLVGGSTRVPKVREMLKEKLGIQNLCCSINPDEAVAWGAAIQAHIVWAKNSGNKRDTRLTGVTLIDVTPLTIGFRVKGGVMDPIIPRNTAIPVEEEKKYTTTEDNQTEIAVKAYEGERAMAEDNHFLGSFTIQIPPAPAEEPEVFCTVKIDEDGIMSIIAEETKSEVTQELIVQADKRHVKKEDIEKSLQDAEQNRILDEQMKARAGSTNELLFYVRDLKRLMNEDHGTEGMGDEDIRAVIAVCEETQQWVNQQTRSVPQLKQRQEMVEDEYERIRKQAFARQRAG